MTYYKSYRIIEGKGKWVVVNENGRIINKNAKKEELKLLQKDKLKFYKYMRRL